MDVIDLKLVISVYIKKRGNESKGKTGFRGTISRLQ